MNTTTLAVFLPHLLACKRPIRLEGQPGIGKTSVPLQVAKALDIETEVVHMPLMKVEDFGITFFNPDTKKIESSVPPWFPCEGSKHGPKGILIFDDSNQADQSLQKVMANIMQARVLNGRMMLDGWSVIRTGNRVQDRCGAVKQLGHLSNRETIVQVEVELDDWTTWAVNNGVHESVVAFLRMNPNLLMDYKADRDINPTPRSWVEGVSNLMTHFDSRKEISGYGHLQEIFSGAVSEGAAIQFIGFLKYRADMPDMDKILKNPKEFVEYSRKVDLTKKRDLLYQIVVSLAMRLDEKNCPSVMEIVKDMEMEYITLAFMIITARCKALPADEKDKIYKQKSFRENLSKVSSTLMPSSK